MPLLYIFEYFLETPEKWKMAPEKGYEIWWMSITVAKNINNFTKPPIRY